MKVSAILTILFSFIIINCGGSSHGTYMHNRTLEQRIADEEREKVVEEEQNEKRMQGSVDQKMEEFNRKALEKQPEKRGEEQ